MVDGGPGREQRRADGHVLAPPRFTSNTQYAPGDLDVKPFQDAAVADRDVQVTMSGHAHIYERFAPMGSTAPDPAGVRHFVVGTGGNNHTEFGTTFQPGSEARDSTTFGALKVVLHADGSWDWQFVAAAGTG